MEGVEAIAFDLYGTLLEVASVGRAATEVTGEPAAMVELWRQKQLEYTWLRLLMGRYQDFWATTGDALDFALDRFGLVVDDAGRARLLGAWLDVRPYPEVPGALSALAPRRLAVLSNGNPDMLEGGLAAAGLRDRFEPVLSVVFGLAVIGAAFMLSWAAEAAQLDISAGLAIAVLAFIAVLPEYAVDLVFALKGGHAHAAYGPTCQSVADKLAGNDSPCALALANMTGSNRLLIGLGWTLVVFIAWRRYRQRGVRVDGVELERSHSVELAFLSVATVYSLTLPLKRTITLVDAAVLISLFIAYVVRISGAPAEEPHLVGPAALIGTFPVVRR